MTKSPRRSIADRGTRGDHAHEPATADRWTAPRCPGGAGKASALLRIAYREPVWQSGASFGNALLVSDPACVKHVLLDDVANYPKADMERGILGAAFGEGLLTLEGEKSRAHRPDSQIELQSRVTLRPSAGCP